jgi:dihydroxyacid dehydratase/phosphogluconate dehydratase
VDIISTFLSHLIAAGGAIGIWKALEVFGILKKDHEDVMTKQTGRALEATGLGLDTLERVIDSLEKRIAQQEKDYQEDLDRLKRRYEEDTAFLKSEIKQLRDILREKDDRLNDFEAILRDHNLLPDES